MFFNNRSMNDIMIDHIVEYTSALEACDRIQFRKDITSALAMESADPKARGAIVNSLYQDVATSAKMVNFGKIPNSHGDIMSLEHWDITAKGISYLNDLIPGTDRLKTLNDMQDFLISARADFEYGYKYDIEIIKTLYCVMVMCMYDLFDSCIVQYSNTVNGNNFPVGHEYAYRSANQYITMYKSGEWAVFMRSMKNPKVAAAGESYLINQITAPAEEGLADVSDVVSGGPFGLIGTAAAAFVIILMASRGLIRYFFRKSAQATVYLRNQAEFLDSVTMKDSSITPETKNKVERQKNKMISLAAWIDRNILKAEKSADADTKDDAKVMKAALDEVSQKPNHPAKSQGSKNPKNISDLAPNSEFTIL